MNVFRPELEKSGARAKPLSNAIAQVEQGYPFASFVNLAERLDVAQARLAEVLCISSSTLQRRRDGAFNVAESGRIYGLEQLFTLAERTIGDSEDARRWLTSENLTLGAAPLELAQTAPGLEAVTRYLEQIADGVYL